MAPPLLQKTVSLPSSHVPIGNNPSFGVESGEEVGRKESVQSGNSGSIQYSVIAKNT